MPGPFLAKSLGPYPNTPLARTGFQAVGQQERDHPILPGRAEWTVLWGGQIKDPKDDKDCKDRDSSEIGDPCPCASLKVRVCPSTS